MGESIVEWFGKGPGGSDCGYCKSQDSNISSGMWAHKMSCQTYENLLNRGWRRSGKYCYKPAMDETCCPQYTIKCDITQFKLSKSQKKVLKRLKKYLVSGDRLSTKEDGIPSIDVGKETLFNQPVSVQAEENINLDTQSESNFISQNPPSIHQNEEKQDFPTSLTSQNASVLDEAIQGKANTSQNKTVSGADPNKPRCQKAKVRRREKKVLKLRKLSGGSTDLPKTTHKVCSEKSIEDFIDELPSEVKHKLEFSLINVKDTASFEATFDIEFALYCKYQHVIHGDAMDELTERQFRQFLVEGPLHFVPPDDEEVPSPGFGAFHHQYFLDGKLIAVGVIDILPHCVSSKYFFYDPDYMFLSLGTYSALREIYFIRSLNMICPELKYYYMGFYIHDCPKMKYKAKYFPSFLLCPETYIWQPVEECVKKFSVSKYSRLEDDETKKPPPMPDMNSALILNNKNIKTFNKFVKRLPTKQRLTQASEIKEYVRLVGSQCNNILLYRS